MYARKMIVGMIVGMIVLMWVYCTASAVVFNSDADSEADSLRNVGRANREQLLTEKGHKPDELLVRFEPKTNGKRPDKAEKNAFLASIGAGNVKRSYHLVPGLTVVKLPEGLTVENALTRFKGKGEILYAEHNWEVHALATPNDPNYSDLWGMHNTGQTGGTTDADIDAPEAWDIETDANEIVVAVIDSGVDYTHPDLAGNMWSDANGYYGYDFVNEDNNPMDDFFHGTHCAGTIGAVGDNGTGVTGVCWDVQIMAVKFLDSTGSGSTDDAISSIEYAVDNGADILSNSWGGGGVSEALEDAIEAADANGVLFVAAAGNDGLNNDTRLYPNYPSSYECNNIIAVLATEKFDALSSFSCYGFNSVDLGAPGSSILSTFPTSETSAMSTYGFSTYYETIGGTSMATPHVAGACALVWSQNPTLSHIEVKDTILETVDPTLPGLCLTGGRLNLYGAVLNKNVHNTTQGQWYDTIQAAIDDANDDDMIRVRPGTYYERIDFKGKAITVRNNNPADPCMVAATVIDGNNGGTVVKFKTSEEANSVLTGFTITGGYAMGYPEYGGGIWCSHASPTISNCVIKDNYSGSSYGFNSGGGLRTQTASPTVTDCVFQNNSTDGYGGGIGNWSQSNPTITNCTFIDNHAHHGGGISNYQSSPAITNCTFITNEGDNTAGGVFNAYSSAEITYCVFSGNDACGVYGMGGAIYNVAQSSGEITNCVFIQNEATNHGGAIFSDTSGNWSMVNCTFSENSAAYGGALRNYGGDPKISNCIFWNNTATTDGNEVYNNAGADPNFRYCDIEGSGGSGSWDPNFGTDGGGNIDVDPNFVDDSDPDGTDDIWATSDDGLALDSYSKSPCIDAGDNDAVDCASDIAGYFRRRNDPWTSDTGTPANDAPYVDMGAYEYTGDPLTLYVDVNATGGVYDGLSWSTAMKSVAEAVGCGLAGDEIRVAKGTYVLNSTLLIDENIDIYGGYDADTGQRNWQSNTTTIDGANTVRCFYVTAECNIDGLTITKGYSYSPGLPSLSIDGGGMVVEGSGDVNVANCTFTNNRSLVYGGGLLSLASAPPTVTNCLFTENSAGYGGGLYGGGMTVTDCNFSGNSATYVGGGMLIWASPTVTSCVFSVNSAVQGGGVYVGKYSYAVLTDCLFSGNTADKGGGLYNWRSYGEVHDCNFYQNSAELGGGIYNLENDPEIIDCNLIGNTAETDGGGIYSVDSDTKVEYCTFNGNEAGRNGGGVYNHEDDSSIKYCDFVDNVAEDDGGGIYNEYGQEGTSVYYPYVYYCTFTGNDCNQGDGGGIYNDSSDADVSRCTFSSHTTAANGGGIYNDSSDASLYKCTFSNNTISGDGAGIYNDASSPSVKYCEFSGNSADDGGGMYSDSASAPIVEGCEFTANTASSNGGGMCNDDADAIIDDSVFEKNTADDGGAMANYAGASAKVTSCIFWDNNSVDDGGAIANDSSSPMIINCTFFDNEAVDDGGGIYNYDSSPTVTNCILWSDSAGGSGDEIYEGGSSSPDVTYSCVDGDYPGSDNTDEDPEFFDDTDPKGDDEDWATCDDGLIPTNDDDVIDEGDDDASDEDYDGEDIIGTDRIINGDVDMGAYEYDEDCDD